ncbi:MAG: hypothetical protein EA374_02055 [Acholeplasmatales bacterium]|nr:MAG: hypothetical protein EA374_02055 [Acholeplasmatales bacterium]
MSENDQQSIFSKQYYDTARNRENEEPEDENIRLFKNIALFLLGFVIPMAGFIAYVMMRDERPKDARFPGIGCLFGFILMFTWAFLPLFVN